MSKSPPKLNSQRIIALWRNDPAWAPTFQELSQALGLGRRDEPTLRKLLDDLHTSGALQHHRRRYTLGTSQSAPGHDPHRARPVPATRVEPAGLVGVFSAHPNGFGFGDLTGAKDSLFIPPPYIGGAMDGDRVRLELRAGSGRDRGTARVVEVLERRHRRVRGHVQVEGAQCWMAPFNEKLPLIFISEGEQRPPWPDGTIVEAAITTYPEHHDEAPEGRIMQVFEGNADAPEQVVLHILTDLSLSADFSPATLKEMERLQPADARTGRGRQDQRDLPYVTIDGADARDFDDAVCVQPQRGGRQKLYVAIADVAAYVTPGSAVDGDAYRKGTSVYFPNQVFPMLPERLSNDLCSLRPNEERLALVCEMELDGEGHRTGYRIYESLIRSQARLTYAQVQHFFETGEEPAIGGHIAEMLTRMRALATTLREMRAKRGALDFTFPEYKFELDAKGFPARVLETYPTEATRLIEQFMLEANETVAAHCDEHGLPVLYRVHDPPPADTVHNLSVTLLNFGVELKASDLGKPGAIRDLLGRVKGHAQREQIEVAILRSMSQAQYRASNDGHFALAAPNYAHFTSPIRRYPDLLLHRALKAEQAGRRPVALPADAGLQTSLAERTAGEAENRVVRLYKVLYMEPRAGGTFPATVTGLSERGLWVRLRDEPIDGLLPMGTLPLSAPHYDRNRSRVITRGKGPTIGIGQRLRVLVARTDRLTQQIEFAYYGWEWEAGTRGPQPEPERPAATRGAGQGRPASRRGGAAQGRQGAGKARDAGPAKKSSSRRGGRGGSSKSGGQGGSGGRGGSSKSGGQSGSGGRGGAGGKSRGSGGRGGKRR